MYGLIANDVKRKISAPLYPINTVHNVCTVLCFPQVQFSGPNEWNKRLSGNFQKLSSTLQMKRKTFLNPTIVFLFIYFSLSIFFLKLSTQEFFFFLPPIFESLHLLDLTTWSASSRSPFFSYAVLIICVNSLFIYLLVLGGT